MSEQTKTPEEFIKEVRLKRNIYHDNFPDFIIAQMLRDYKNQFPSLQEVTEITEEEIRSVGAARSQSMPSLMAASGFLNGFKEGAKWMREKLTNK